MLSYQHTYHAGNHADVLKHIILTDVLTGLQIKENPLFLLDAFASRGIYDLASAEAGKNREFDTGIGRLWPLREDRAPAGVRRWLELIEDENLDSSLCRFPGSTALLTAMRRPQDRLVACDLHPQEFEALRRSFSGSPGIELHRRDAFEALKALLPPKERRGLIFLDPSYEIKDEYRAIAKAVAAAHKRFAQGVCVIWYPLLPAERHLDLFNEMKRSGMRKVLQIELDCGDCFPDMQMHGSGMLIVNPPWNARENLQASLRWMNEKLTGGKGQTRFGWLVPE